MSSEDRLLTIAASRFAADVEDLLRERPDLDRDHAAVYVTMAWQALTPTELPAGNVPLEPPDWRTCHAWIDRRWPRPAGAAVIPPTPVKPGPDPIITREEVLAIRDSLPPNRRGAKSVAKEAKVSPATVKRRLSGR